DSPSPFKATARALLDGIDDNAWVFWCICDRYPSNINIKSIETIFEYITSGSVDSYNAVRVINLNEEVRPQPVYVNGLVFFPKVGFVGGFWHHQFLRARVLRFNLLHPALDEQYQVSDLNQRFPLIADRPGGMISVFERTLVPREAIMRISEPCIKGQITANGLADLKNYGCKIPDLPSVSMHVHF
ncbi:MAG: hypothetical protein GTN46_09645, partial [Gammaproteobacteria bacterium]|nr:hypothetical protein [Gammaproteobacteria bacterium]